jgi:hypothetical protein
MWLFRECAALPERTRKRVFLQPVAYTVGGFYELWNRTGVPEKEDDWLLYVNMSLTGRRGGSDGLLVCERSLAWTDGGVVWDLALDPAHRPPTVGPGIGFTSGASVSFDLHNIAIRNTGADAAMAELVVALVRRLGGR